MSFLDEAHALAQRTREMQRIAPVALARAEAAWLHGEPQSAIDEVRDALTLADRIGMTMERDELAEWLWRLGGCDARPSSTPTGDPYRNALVHLLRQKLRAHGVRGPRSSTKAFATPTSPRACTSRRRRSTITCRPCCRSWA